MPSRRWLFGYIERQVKGALAYFDGVDWHVLPPGTSGQVLTTGGAGAAPSWGPGGGSGGSSSPIYIPFGSEAEVGQAYAP